MVRFNFGATSDFKITVVSYFEGTVLTDSNPIKKAPFEFDRNFKSMNKTLALTALAAFADAVMPDVSSFKSSFGLGGIAHKQQMSQMDPQY